MIPERDATTPLTLAALRLIDEGRLDAALELGRTHAESLAGTAEGLWLLGELAARAGDLDAADRHFRALLDFPAGDGVEPALLGTRPLERLACASLERQDLPIATIYALRAVRADRTGPVDAVAETVRLRTMIFDGAADAASEALTVLLAHQPGSPSARRLAGELAWTQGDAPEALVQWTLGAEPGHPPSGGGEPWRSIREADARAWCAVAVAILQMSQGLTPAPAVGRDTESLSGAIVIAILQGKPVRFPAGTEGAIVRDASAWIRLLEDLGATRVIETFASHARRYSRLLPGIEGLCHLQAGEPRHNDA